MSDDPFQGFPQSVKDRFKKVQGTQVGDTMIARVSQDRNNYAKWIQLLNETKLDEKKTLPFQPMYLRHVPTETLTAHQSNLNKFFNGWTQEYCKSRSKHDSASFNQCVTFVHGAFMSGTQQIKKIHKEYFYSPYGPDE